MRDTVGRLVNALDEFDDSSPVFVNICGHLHRIAYVEGQVGYTEIRLLDEGNVSPQCAVVSSPLFSADDNGARYPDAHEDIDDTCNCPDHVAIREEWRETAGTIGDRIFRQLFDPCSSRHCRNPLGCFAPNCYGD